MASEVSMKVLLPNRNKMENRSALLLEESKFLFDDLEGRSYRYLQQLAKSLSLPSNVKKIYLIQLIHAKKFKTPSEVDGIVQRVKFERQRLSQVRKRPIKRRSHLQGTEVSSTSITQSPPIVTTPKRPGHIIMWSPDIRQTIMKYSRPSLLRPFIKKQHLSPRTNQSDRVLRSFSLKPKQTLSNAVLSVVKTQNPESPKENRMNVVSQGPLYPKLNFTAKCLVKKHRPNIIQSQSAGKNIYPPLPAKRNRVVSGIYPIAIKETPKVSYEYIQSIGFRRSDGKMTKINALVQKTLNKEPPSQNSRNIEMTVQELINSNVTQNVQNQHSHESSLQYPNMSGVTDFDPNYQRQCNHYGMAERNYSLCKDNQSSVYYHKKIRAEQVRSQRRFSIPKEVDRSVDSLPKIQDVFSKFRDVHDRDVTQPIYVQVSEESERIQNYPMFMAKANPNNTTMLESLYNFKNQFLVSQPLLQIATTASTRCVFSTPLISTPMAQTSTVASNDAYNVSSCERDSQSSTEPDYLTRINDLMMTDPDLTSRRDYRGDAMEDFNTSGSSLDRSNSQVLGSSATIPEMVEDALEIISQDGDYMERIGMDVRVQCILCSWAGPRFILEYHIRKDHTSQIYRPDRSECSVTYTLGSLVRHQLWLSQVIERQSGLYVLSAKYEPPDCFMASLSVLSSDIPPTTGQLTIYNKVTGEPHTWSGEIQTLSPNLPYCTETTCLKLTISGLDLLPNSANLMLLNRELVIKSPGRVVVGRPELDDIHIVLYINIED